MGISTVCLFICLVTDEKDWTYINKLRKLRDGDNYTALKRGEPSPEYGAVGNSPPQMVSLNQADDMPSRLYEDPGLSLQETVRKQVVNLKSMHNSDGEIYLCVTSPYKEL